MQTSDSYIEVIRLLGRIDETTDTLAREHLQNQADHISLGIADKLRHENPDKYRAVILPSTPIFELCYSHYRTLPTQQIKFEVSQSSQHINLVCQYVTEHKMKDGDLLVITSKLGDIFIYVGIDIMTGTLHYEFLVGDITDVKSLFKASMVMLGLTPRAVQHLYFPNNEYVIYPGLDMKKRL